MPTSRRELRRREQTAFERAMRNDGTDRVRHDAPPVRGGVCFSRDGFHYFNRGGVCVVCGQHRPPKV